MQVRRRTTTTLAATAVACGMLATPGRALATDGDGERGGPRLVQELSLSLGAPNGFTAALSYVPNLRLLEGRVLLGLGARLTAWRGGSGVDLRNVNPDLGGASDRLVLDGPRAYALNAAFSVAVRVVAGLEVGFNIDLVGAGVGPDVRGRYTGSATLSGDQVASPPTLNLLLLGRRDRGFLNSELFLAWWFGDVGVRGGLSHVAHRFRTSRPLDAGNRDYGSFLNRAVVAGSYRF
jgi:hypothetical protein